MIESRPFQTCAPNVDAVPMLLPTVPSRWPAAKLSLTQRIAAAARTVSARTLVGCALLRVNHPPPLKIAEVPCAQPSDTVLRLLCIWSWRSKLLNSDVPPEPACVTTTSLPSGVNARWPPMPSTTNARPWICRLPREDRTAPPCGVTTLNVHVVQSAHGVTHA